MPFRTAAVVWLVSPTGLTGGPTIGNAAATGVFISGPSLPKMTANVPTDYRSKPSSLYFTQDIRRFAKDFITDFFYRQRGAIDFLNDFPSTPNPQKLWERTCHYTGTVKIGDNLRPWRLLTFRWLFLAFGGTIHYGTTPSVFRRRVQELAFSAFGGTCLPR
ncbi:hypothetical protein BDR22DRAFT_891473 [Usnea florida]